MKVTFSLFCHNCHNNLCISKDIVMFNDLLITNLTCAVCNISSKKIEVENIYYGSVQ